MVKVRPVIVVSPRRRTSRVVTVIPVSTTAPVPAEPWHVLLPPALYPGARAPSWAKCDMLTAVALDRLDRVRIRDAAGRRVYVTPRLDALTVAAVQTAAKAALDWP